MNSSHSDVLVVGAGLSGLHTAWQLQQNDLSVQVVEARERPGGRIFCQAAGMPASLYDMGPAWFWPGQPYLEQLLDALELQGRVFPQWTQGKGLLQQDNGYIERGIQGITMRDAYRLDGGFAQVIDALLNKLTPETLRTHTSLTHLELTSEGILCTLRHQNTVLQHVAQQVVLALPPRLGAQLLEFKPAINTARLSELRAVPTWMANHAKFLAVYEHPFWRDQELSGDAISYKGPLQEIHDASPATSEHGALFGFFGLLPDARRSQANNLTADAIDQLTDLFGSALASPVETFLMDWAQDPWCATEMDLRPVAVRAIGGLNQTLEPGWDERLFWSGTETSAYANGVLEGAVAASMKTVEKLKESINRGSH